MTSSSSGDVPIPKPFGGSTRGGHVKAHAQAPRMSTSDMGPSEAPAGDVSKRRGTKGKATRGSNAGPR